MLQCITRAADVAARSIRDPGEHSATLTARERALAHGMKRAIERTEQQTLALSTRTKPNIVKHRPVRSVAVACSGSQRNSINGECPQHVARSVAQSSAASSALLIVVRIGCSRVPGTDFHAVCIARSKKSESPRFLCGAWHAVRQEKNSLALWRMLWNSALSTRRIELNGLERFFFIAVAELEASWSSGGATMSLNCHFSPAPDKRRK